MEGVLKKFFDQKAGYFINVENMQCNPGSGQVSLQKAEFKAEVFDQLHLPFTLKGGFVDEMTVNMPIGLFSETAAHVVIKNVFLVFGPHTTDWSWEHVHNCKSKLIDLVMKVYDLKPPKKKKVNKGGMFADMKDKLIEDMKKKFLGMLEVNISGIHIRYEDSVTQASPFAGGFKIGFIDVASSHQRNDAARRLGNWKGVAECADPLFSQDIHARRISAYWDLGLDESQLFARGPVNGKEVDKKIRRLNIREAFSTCVVQTILTLFPVEHRRRKFLEGPGFRERLDFHQYVLFPASLRAHVLANRKCAATVQQKAPLKDAYIHFYPLEVSVDSAQVQSVNALLSHAKAFFSKDKLFRSRPRDPIHKYIDRRAQVRESPSASSSCPPNAASLDVNLRRHEAVCAWWQHAVRGVCMVCEMPNAHLDPQELKRKAKFREEYIRLAMEDFAFTEADKVQAAAGSVAPSNDAAGMETRNVGAKASVRSRLQELQMLVSVQEALDWRILARDRKREQIGKIEEDAYEEQGRQDAELQPVERTPPNTMQVQVHFRAFQAYFLLVADQNWKTAMSKPGRPSRGTAQQLPSQKSNSRALTRQLVIKAQVLNVNAEMVQKGRPERRMARWFQVGIGNVSVTNCSALRTQHSVRQILSVAPFKHRTGVTLCIFIGFTMYKVADRKFEDGDVPLSAMLEPSAGIAAHLNVLSAQDHLNLLTKLGFLREYTDEVGRLMTFGYVRSGQVRLLDYTPFRRRLMYFLKRGRSHPSLNLVKRPSPMAIDRALLVQLQRKVEKITGKSDMMGFVEGVVDGVRGRLVDHYNSQHVLCKEVSLAPLRVKAIRNGCPQAFHMQFHQLAKSGQRPTHMLLPPLAADGFGLLPWKVAMLLLPRSEFKMGLEVEMTENQEPEGPTRELIKSQSRSSSTKGSFMVVATNSDLRALEGAYFLKWGRNGKAKLRFVSFDESLDAVVWKNLEDDKVPIGIIPLSKVQDVCIGVQTPVLLKVKSSKLRPDKVWSIVTTERTLDLQAESVAQKDQWVSDLKAQYRKHVQKWSIGGEVAASMPKALEKKTRPRATYPEKYRSSQCALRSTYRKLQAITALGETLSRSDLGAD